MQFNLHHAGSRQEVVATVAVRGWFGYGPMRWLSAWCLFAMISMEVVAQPPGSPQRADSEQPTGILTSNPELADSLESLSMRELQAYLRQAARSPNLEGYRFALWRMAERYLDRSNLEAAGVAIREGLRTGPTAPDRWPFLDLQARLHEHRYEPMREREALQEAIRSASPRLAGSQLVTLHSRLSKVEQQLGEMESAFEQVYRGLSLAEEMEWWHEIPSLLTRIGSLFLELENQSEAVIHLERAVRLAEELEMIEEQREAELVMARLFRQIGDAEASLDLLEGVRRRGVRQSEQAAAWALEFGRWQAQFGVEQEARNLLRESLQGFRDRSDEAGEAEVHLSLAELEWNGERYDEAVRQLQEALSGLDERRHTALILQIHDRRYRYHRDREEYQLALRALEARSSIERLLDEREYDRVRAEYEARFEVRRRQEENRALLAEQAQQEARISFQRWVGMGGGLLFLFLSTISFYLYRDVKERTRLNRDLEEKNRELDRLGKVKNRMLAIVSHDLRSPLHSFDGLLELLEKGKVGGDQLTRMGAQLRSRIRSVQMTMENLLAWAKTQMSGVDLHPEEVAIHTVVDRVWEAVSGPAEEKGITLRNRVPESQSSWSDPDVVRLVLRNLLGNAIKFSHVGGEIDIVASEVDGRVRVTVADEGVGIPDELQGQILSGEGLTREGTANEKGSGLGLSLSRSYVESQGGTLWFESTPGQGTRFHFTLPATGRAGDEHGGEA